ncbi:MAG: recombination protein RecR [Ignavibacteriaceae bacterium]|nr:recombination protein RecR [Ignavibacteriaceae bacterium]
MIISDPLRIAIEEFSRFPGIGRKTAQRLVLHLLRSHQEDFDRFIESLTNIKLKLHYCSRCFNITEHELCEICSSTKRDDKIICVVEEINDVIAIEKSNEFQGVYHVLGGVLSPLNGVTHEDLKIEELMVRVENNPVQEIILALNPDTEGEATSLHIYKLLKDREIRVTRLARGIPIGGDLEFADEATIGRAVLNRVEL